MTVTTITTKGQITIPLKVRQKLGLEPGDKLLIELEADGETLKVRMIKRKDLSDFYGILPATRPFPGRDDIRHEVAKALAQEMLDKTQ